MADNTRRDVIYFKESNGKTFAVRLGTAVEGKKDGTTYVYLDAIPPSVEGQYKFSIVPQREKREGAQTGSSAPPDDDGAPF